MNTIEALAMTIAGVNGINAILALSAYKWAALCLYVVLIASFYVKHELIYFMWSGK